jgi:uncharacterized protein DUF397
MENNGDLQWRRSHHCDSDHCVEIAMTHDSVLVRQSREPTGPSLRFSHAEWRAFLQGVADGDFDGSDGARRS